MYAQDAIQTVEGSYLKNAEVIAGLIGYDRPAYYHRAHSLVHFTNYVLEASKPEQLR